MTAPAVPTVVVDARFPMRAIVYRDDANFGVVSADVSFRVDGEQMAAKLRGALADAFHAGYNAAIAHLTTDEEGTTVRS